MFVLALSLYNTWNRGVFLLCKITNLLIYSTQLSLQQCWCKWSTIQPKYFNKIIATIPIVFLPVIVALIIHMLSLSSLLLLRNPHNTFAFIPLPAMSLSSLNRSNPKAFCHIMPYSAPVCEGMYYHKTGVPWQTNNTLIIDFNLLKMP